VSFNDLGSVQVPGDVRTGVWKAEATMGRNRAEADRNGQIRV